jgi:HSP20 family molecular chaperone IbpA
MTMMMATQVAEQVVSASIMPVDVEDMEDSYYFIADVPGLEKDDIRVRLPACRPFLFMLKHQKQPVLAGS